MWVQNLLEKSRPQFVDPGAFLDAVAIGLSAGLSPDRAEAEARSLEAIGTPDSEAEASLAECLTLSTQTGSSIRSLLLDAAQSIRATHRNIQAQAISKLQIRLMLPLGLLTLPAFVLLAVAPMAIGMLTQQ
jgi:tight adherence protein B